jgi:hypothetical protein
MTLHPQTAAAFAVATETQLVDVYARLLSEEVLPDSLRSPAPILRIDAGELAEVLGTRHAYLTAFRLRFELDSEGRYWTRCNGFRADAETVEIDPYPIAAQARRARRSLDPYKLLNPFLGGLMGA